MTGAIRRLTGIVHWLENVLLVCLLGAMIGLAVLQIVLRNGFETGIPWLAPMLRALVLWIAMAGAIVASRDRRHISSDLIGRFLPKPWLRYTGLITCWATSGICLAVAWYSFQFVRMEYESPSMAFANVPSWLCESIIPAAFALIAVRYFTHGWLSALGRETHSGAPQP